MRPRPLHRGPVCVSDAVQAQLLGLKPMLRRIGDVDGFGLLASGEREVTMVTAHGGKPRETFMIRVPSMPTEPTDKMLDDFACTFMDSFLFAQVVLELTRREAVGAEVAGAAVFFWPTAPVDAEWAGIYAERYAAIDAIMPAPAAHFDTLRVSVLASGGACEVLTYCVHAHLVGKDFLRDASEAEAEAESLTQTTQQRPQMLQTKKKRGQLVGFRHTGEAEHVSTAVTHMLFLSADGVKASVGWKRIAQSLYNNMLEFALCSFTVTPEEALRHLGYITRAHIIELANDGVLQHWVRRDALHATVSGACDMPKKHAYWRLDMQPPPMETPEALCTLSPAAIVEAVHFTNLKAATEAAREAHGGEGGEGGGTEGERESGTDGGESVTTLVGEASANEDISRQ